MPRFKSNIFYYNSPKIKLFLQKMQNFRALGAPPPDPVPLAGGGFAQKPQNSGSLGHRSQTPICLRRLRASPTPQNSPPHCKLLARHLVIYCSIILMFWGIIVQVSQYIVMFVCFYCYLSSAVIFYSFIFL